MRRTSLKTVVSHLFSASTRPIYLVDASRVLVYCNQALADWLGVGVEELVGRRCVYSSTSVDSLADVANQLSPPPQAWSTAASSSPLNIARPNGVLHRHAQFLRIDQADESAALLVLVNAREADAKSAPDQEAAESLHARIAELHQAWRGRFHIDRLVGESPAMRRVRGQVDIAASSDCRVVIVGPPGSGRETVARTIHQHRSQGKTAPLAPMSCDLLDAELLASTVSEFVRQCAELREESFGTLLLLDADRLSAEAQAALVGYLEIPELELQSIATAGRPLSERVAEHTFRHDLACDLGTLEITLPALSDRLEDLPLIAQWMVEERNRAGEKQLGGFTPAAMDWLLGYAWPGQVAELREFVLSAHAHARGALIDVEDLPPKIQLAAEAASVPPAKPETIVLDKFLAEVETELLTRALRQAKGNRAQAARMLGISRPRLLRRIEQLGVVQDGG